DSRADRLAQLHAVCAEPGCQGALTVVTGDVSQPGLALDEAGRAALRGARHVFHLAALYDSTATEGELLEANAAGTRHLLEALGAEFRGVLHHVSSVAVAGDYQGTFSETMFDEGQS